MSAASEVQGKLKVMMGGPGKLESKIAETRGRLAEISSKRWRTPQAPGRLRRFFYCKQKLAPDEVDDIRAAYSKFLDEKLEFAKRIVSEIEYLRRVDEDFHRAAIEQRLLLLQQLSPLLFQAQQQSGRHPD